MHVVVRDKESKSDYFCLSLSSTYIIYHFLNYLDKKNIEYL